MNIESWLGHPAVQAGLAPFIAALVVAFALRGTHWRALSIGCGIAAVTALTTGLVFESLTAARKLALAGLSASVVGAVAESRQNLSTSRMRWALAAACGGAAIWMLWRVLQQMDMARAAGAALGAFVFAGVLVAGVLHAARQPSRALAAAAVLAVGAGVLSLLGASALLAQLGIGAGVAAAAALVVFAVAGAAGWGTALPVACIASLVSLAAAFTGTLHWSALVPLALAPWLAAWPALHPRGDLVEAAIGAAIAAAALVPAFVLAWFVPGT